MSVLKYIDENGNVTVVAQGVKPQRGIDYYTEADKAEMVSLVKASLTTETWTFTLEDGSTVNKAVLLG